MTGSDTLLLRETPLYLYHHTHWDREWYQGFREYQIRLAEVIDAILDRLDSKVISCFMLDGQTVALEDYRELRPERWPVLSDYIQKGQIRVGPWFVMPDEFLVSGESLLRNLQRGIQESTHLGCTVVTGYLPDTFGHSSAMPKIFNHCGIETAIIWRGHNPKHSVFLWQSATETSGVLTLHLTQGYFQNLFHDPENNDAIKETALRTAIETLAKHTPDGFPILLPVGGDHLGPLTPAHTQALNQALSTIAPQHTETTAADAMTAFQQTVFQTAAKTHPTGLETVIGELRDHTGSFLLPGVLASRIYLKQANKRAEHLLTRILEPLSVIAQHQAPNAIHGSQQALYLESLQLAWKTLLLNHPHDSICGCSIDPVHRENEVRFDQVFQIGHALKHRLLGALASRLNTAGKANPTFAINLSEDSYTGILPIRTLGESIVWPPGCYQPCQTTTVLKEEHYLNLEDVPLADRLIQEETGWLWVTNLPPLSAQSLDSTHLEQLSGKPSDTVSLHTSQNQHYRLENQYSALEINLQTKQITLMDKQNGLHYEDTHQIWDRSDQGDSYNHAPVPDSPGCRWEILSANPLEQCPLFSSIQVQFQQPNASKQTLTTTFQLAAGSPQLTCISTFTNTEPNHRLQVLFSTPEPIHHVHVEGHFGEDRRLHDPAYTLESAMPAPSQKELKTNTGPLQRYVRFKAQAWLTEGLCEYEVKGTHLGLTLLRSFGMLSKADTGVRGAQAGPPLPTPEGQCINRSFSLRYAWLPMPAREADPNTVRSAYCRKAADQFYGLTWAETISLPPHKRVPETPKTQNQTALSASLFSWENPNIVLSACHLSTTTDGIVLRLLNLSATSETVTLFTALPNITLCPVNALEKPLKPADNPLKESFTLTFQPGEIQSFLFQVQ